MPARERQGRARQGRERQGRLRATGRERAAGREEAVEAEVVTDILSHGRKAMLIDEGTFAQLTDAYISDDDFDDGVVLRGLSGMSPTEVKAMMQGLSVIPGDQVSAKLSAQAWQDIRQQPRDKRMLAVDEERNHYTSAAEATEIARQLHGDVVVRDGWEALVPGAHKVAPGAFQAVVYRQPLDSDDSQERPRHVITGDPGAMHKLRNGNIQGLVLRRAAPPADAADLERLGGGSHEQWADVAMNTNVFEVIDAGLAKRWRA